MKKNRRYLWFGINIDNIKQLSKAVTESNYSDYSKQGYDMLIAIHDLGLTKGSVYKIFYEYYKSLEVGLLREWFADMLDYICGWCDPEKYIWKDE